MEILLDNPATEKQFQELLVRVKRLKNGVTAQTMKEMGAEYKMNWGASVISLRDLAKNYEKNHLLALKLWNKQWRETMVLATLLDEPDLVTEEQMDYWAKSFETVELAEQSVANLFVYTKFAFAKAIEWCRGKKHLVRYSGLLLMGRLALIDKKAIDEMFEPFFEVLMPLSKDPALAQIFYRTFLLLAYRSQEMKTICFDFLSQMQEQEEEQARKMANLLIEELSEEDNLENEQ